MNGITDLATYGATGICIAIIIAIVYMVTKCVPIYEKIMAEMRHSIEANTKVTTEMYEFLKNLNGKLRKVTKKR